MSISRALPALLLLAAAPAAAGWGYDYISRLRPDARGDHPATVVQKIVLTEAEPAPACLCVDYHAQRRPGRLAVVEVEATVSRGRHGERVGGVTLAPFRLRDGGSSGLVGYAARRRCAPATAARFA